MAAMQDCGGFGFLTVGNLCGCHVGAGVGFVFSQEETCEAAMQDWGALVFSQEETCVAVMQGFRSFIFDLGCLERGWFWFSHRRKSA